MRRYLTAAVLLLASTAASAQSIALHGHAQKAAYASSAEWPTDSAQCHWTPAGADPSIAMIGHTHVDMKFPRYAEINGPLTIPFAVKLFHVDGQITEVIASEVRGQYRGVLTWDATGTSTPPVLIGDPLGLKVWTGHFTIDPFPANPHGWYNVELQVVTQFTNGDMTRAQLMEPAFSTLDLSAPNNLEGPVFAAFCNAGSPRRPEVQNGTIEMFVQDLLPVAPLSVPWVAIMQSLGYGTISPTAAPATMQERVDLDLHAGIPGRIVVEVVGTDPLGAPVSAPMNLDPAILGPGSHKVALIRTQPDGGIEEVSSLLVFDIVVDPNAPPPTTCPPGFHLEGGGCVLDPPPPPDPPLEFWATITASFQRLTVGGIPQNRWRICAASGECAELVIR